MTEFTQLLEEVHGVIDNSHVVYNSGMHGRAYVNWSAVLKKSKAAWSAAQAMADMVFDLQFDTVAGPTHTGDKVASDLGIALLLKGREVARVYAQETGEEGKRNFPRSQEEDVRDKDVLVVDDVLTTGGTIRETVEAVLDAGGKVVAVAVGCNRSALSESLDDFLLLELLKVEMEQQDPYECQACVEKIPVNTSVGHGKDFLAEFGEDPANWPTNKKS